jgi:hypothetical protein
MRQQEAAVVLHFGPLSVFKSDRLFSWASGWGGSSRCRQEAAYGISTGCLYVFISFKFFVCSCIIHCEFIAGRALLRLLRPFML